MADHLAGGLTPLVQAQSIDGNATLLMRTRKGPRPAALRRTVRADIQEMGPDLAVFGVEPLGKSSRTAFAVLALLLALIGVYGVLSYLVAQRGSEMGIRMAQGASRSSPVHLIVVLIVVQGAGLVGLGMMLG